MKKTFFTALILLCSLGISAQDFDLGIKLGANYSTIKDMSDLKHKTGWTGGVFMAVKFNRFAIQPEALYTQQGAKFEGGKFDLDYIAVPVLLKFYLVDDFLNIYAGPQFGFMLDADINVGHRLKSKNFDFTGVAGIGVEVLRGFRIDARYGKGMTDVTHKFPAKNDVFTLSLGFSFL